jgi:hypothetical protein
MVASRAGQFGDRCKAGLGGGNAGCIGPAECFEKDGRNSHAHLKFAFPRVQAQAARIIPLAPPRSSFATTTNTTTTTTRPPRHA